MRVQRVYVGRFHGSIRVGEIDVFRLQQLSYGSGEGDEDISTSIQCN